MKRCWILGTVLLLLNAPAHPQQAPGKKQALEVLPGVTVTVLVENMAGGGPVLGEWGLSFLIETDGHQIILDTGGGLTLLGNVRALNVNLKRTEAIVISHGHEDHTGGLVSALDNCGSVDLFVHPAAFDTRYWKNGASVTVGRVPISRHQLLQRVRRLVETKEPTSVCSGMMVTGQIPRATEFEDTGVRMEAFLDKNLKTPDLIPDDQALLFRVPEGVVILLGRAHAGLVNTMKYVSELTGEQRIYAVMGGTHLISASPARMQKTIEALKQYDVQNIMLSHCTGVRAFAELAAAFPGRCTWPASGARIRFGGR